MLSCFTDRISVHDDCQKCNCHARLLQQPTRSCWTMKTKSKDQPKNGSSKKHNRSRNGTGHVRLRSDGRWEGQYYFDGDRKSCYGKTEEECQGKLNILLGKIYRGSYIEESQMPLYTYLHHWHYEYTEIKPATHGNYDTYIEGHILGSRLGSIPLKKLMLDDFISFFKEKQTSGRLDGRPGGLSPKHCGISAIWFRRRSISR